MAVNYLLKFDAVNGEVDFPPPEGQIRLYSWSWCAHNFSSVGSGGGSGTGKVDLEDFTFITLLDKSSPQFFRHICIGAHVNSAVLSAWKAGDSINRYLAMTFKDVFITKIRKAGSWIDEEKPIAHVAFSFEQVAIEYKIQGTDGKLISTGPVTYNRKENKLS